MFNKERLDLNVGYSMDKEESREHAKRLMEAVFEHLSETLWCAGWNTGCDSVFWFAMLDDARPVGDRRDAMTRQINEIDPELLPLLRVLSRIAGGWITWNEDEGDEREVILISFDEWERRLSGGVTP